MQPCVSVHIQENTMLVWIEHKKDGTSTERTCTESEAVQHERHVWKHSIIAYKPDRRTDDECVRDFVLVKDAKQI